MTPEAASEEAEQQIDLEIYGGIAYLTLDNPRRRNAITTMMARQIVAACDVIDADTSIGAVVLRGRDGYFCSGGDVRALAAIGREPAEDAAYQALSQIYESFLRVGRLLPPSISLVEGGAVGAGLNLALSTDLLLTTPDANLDSGFLARGFHPGGGHISLVARAAGRPGAMAAIAFGQSFTGVEAVRRGLAWDAVPTAELTTRGADLVRRAAADPSLARRIKMSANLELGPPAVSWSASMELERGVQMWSLRRSAGQS